MATVARKVIVEGAAHIALPEGQVFYNPVQVFNRDLSVVAINQFCSMESKRSRWNILEALSATGLRAVRYAKECPQITKITANDIDPAAAGLIRQNVLENGCSDKVDVSCSDANLIMLQAAASKSLFDIIDLDPYGSAAPFLDSAMQAIADGGLLCITCTDMAALCASYTDACIAKYGSLPVKGDICHEFAVRIILNTVERAASRFRRSIEPLMSCSIDFYSRVFVRIHHGKGTWLRAAPFTSGYLLRCPECKHFEVQPMCRSLAKSEKSFKIGPSPLLGLSSCQYCEGNVQLAGPFWTGPMHNNDFVKGLVSTSFSNTITTVDRIKGLATICSEECLLPPLYISIGEFAHVLRAPTPSLDKILYALKNAGYEFAIPHSSPVGIKTNCPFSFLLSIFKKLMMGTSYKFQDENHPIKSKIWANFELKNAFVEPCFDKDDSAIPPSKRLGFVRFPPNPEKNWGPKPRAKSARIDNGNK